MRKSISRLLRSSLPGIFSAFLSLNMLHAATSDSSSTRPDEDTDGDGLTNDEESYAGTFWNVKDSDRDSVWDNLDGWGREQLFSPPRFKFPNYALLNLNKGRGLAINSETEVVYAVDPTLSQLYFWKSGVKTAIVSDLEITRVVANCLTNSGKVLLNGITSDYLTAAGVWDSKTGQFRQLEHIGLGDGFSDSENAHIIYEDGSTEGTAVRSPNLDYFVRTKWDAESVGYPLDPVLRIYGGTPTGPGDNGNFSTTGSVTAKSRLFATSPPVLRYIDHPTMQVESSVPSANVHPAGTDFRFSVDGLPMNGMPISQNSIGETLGNQIRLDPNPFLLYYGAVFPALISGQVFFRTLDGTEIPLKDAPAGHMNSRREIVIGAEVWQNAKRRNLNDLVPEEWTIINAVAINDSGVIVATGTSSKLQEESALILLPVDITIRKKGEQSAPPNGLVVKKGDVLEFAFAPQYFDVNDNFESLITWEYRQMKLDGTFTDWSAFGGSTTGTKFELTTTEGGIYEVKAVVSTGGSSDDYFYDRDKDDKYSKHKKGENDCVGVVDDEWQQKVRDTALGWLGSTAYARGVRKHPIPAGPPGGWKCNLFVGEIGNSDAFRIPWINGYLLVQSYPPVANQWAGVETKNIPNWTLLGTSALPQPGYVVARGLAGGIGHTGFLDYDGAWISAGRDDVHRKADLREETYQPARVRKYSGN